MEPTEFIITDATDAGRYEARSEGQLAGFVEYRVVGGRRVLIHTEVVPEYAGRGLGSTLARHILDDALRSGTRVTVKCPFIRAFLDRHPEYSGIVTQLPARHAAD